MSDTPAVNVLPGVIAQLQWPNYNISYYIYTRVPVMIHASYAEKRHIWYYIAYTFVGSSGPWRCLYRRECGMSVNSSRRWTDVHDCPWSAATASINTTTCDCSFPLHVPITCIKVVHIFWRVVMVLIRVFAELWIETFVMSIPYLCKYQWTDPTSLMRWRVCLELKLKRHSCLLWYDHKVTIVEHIQITSWIRLSQVTLWSGELS